MSRAAVAHGKAPPLSAQTAGRLRVEVRPWTGREPIDFLRSHQGQPRFAHRSPVADVFAAGVAAQIVADGLDRFDVIRSAAQRLFERIDAPADGAGPPLVGGFAFEPTSSDPDFPAARFVLPRSALVVRDGHAEEIHVHGGAEPSPQLAEDHAPDGAPSPWRPEPDFETWARGVRESLQAVRDGRIEKAVLARTVTARPTHAPEAADVLQALHIRAAASHPFLIEPRPGHAIVGASPELLVRKLDDRWETAAVAGSRPRGRTQDEDAAFGRALVASSKDAWEHEIVSRFIRNTLTERGRAWTTRTERQLLKLPNVQHLETRFEATALPGEHLLELAGRLHPTPAVAGSPREPATRLLAAFEARPRGWYAGAVGWFDCHGDGELSVALRTAQLDGPQATLWAGCGIVEGSDPAEEWEESRAKFRLLQSVLEAEESA